ncbi:M17 family metallopeptidase [Bacterioplanoides sp. SCSIO 12839]|uniref:leucyl aminopeptidase family protein n=1 Tax=Bacterioplanoides sp. SCSIO 12839 TaxID=2829569 RepID=UPI002103577C|nr:leucyl aminopeptidase family protein [Bacterioplanoides sp. SCSIO 12839]UTW48692.1 leucyl aminopeptidase family protein [Bacterioplanoides sp. SCSIO 12839]
MSAVLLSAAQASSVIPNSVIALTVLEKQDYSHWLENQPATIQSWLSAMNFSSGAQLLPAADGSAASAVFVCESLDDFFAAGDLSAQLPAGQYQIHNITDADALLAIAFAWGVGAYRFEKYKSNDKPQAQLVLADDDVLKAANDMVQAVRWTRDLINTPAGDMMPQHLAAATEEIAEQFGASVTQVIGDDLLSQNYPTIHAVGRASEHAPRLIDLRWGNPQAPKITLVGKGVCFDSGGLDLKPSAAMRLMKKDMGGAAQVLGLAYLIMSQQLPVHLRVLIPAVENAVSSNAFRPGDVITTRKGTTVEIDNTDAEGRLVLCDALTEAVTDQPEIIFDFATLTGACRVALGTELPGFFTNQLQLAGDLMQQGNKVTDPVWQLPLHKPYKDMLKSDVADMTNSVPGPFGGAITAALYLEHFVDETPWVHFDVMAWNNRKLPGRPTGGEAMGIRAVFAYLQNRYGS